MISMISPPKSPKSAQVPQICLDPLVSNPSIFARQASQPLATIRFFAPSIPRLNRPTRLRLPRQHPVLQQEQRQCQRQLCLEVCGLAVLLFLMGKGKDDMIYEILRMNKMNKSATAWKQVLRTKGLCCVECILKRNLCMSWHCHRSLEIFSYHGHS